MSSVWIRALALALLACALVAPGSAAGADRKPPSADELWQRYPLDATPEAVADPTPHAGGPSARAARRARKARNAAATSGEGGGPDIALLALLVLAGAMGASTAVWLGRRRRSGRPAATSRAPAPPAPPAPVAPSTPSVTPATPVRRRPSPARALLPSGAQTAAGRTHHASQPVRAQRNHGKDTALAPPDPAVAWRAEIDWREVQGAARFQVVARRLQGGRAGVVAESPALEWPPSSPAAVAALRVAADRLEASLREAGWSTLAPGSAWYARRFGWEPAAVSGSAEAPAQPAEQRKEPGRFKRDRAWPEGAGDRWRCEIGWAPGYLRAHFRAVAFPPGSRVGRTIGEAGNFKWLFMADPDRSDPRHRQEVLRLATAVQAAGWEPVGRGPAWYAGRYVWGSDEPPPDRLELQPAEERIGR